MFRTHLVRLLSLISQMAAIKQTGIKNSWKQDTHNKLPIKILNIVPLKIYAKYIQYSYPKFFLSFIR